MLMHLLKIVVHITNFVLMTLIDDLLCIVVGFVRMAYRFSENVFMSKLLLLDSYLAS